MWNRSSGQGSKPCWAWKGRQGGWCGPPGDSFGQVGLGPLQPRHVGHVGHVDLAAKEPVEFPVLVEDWDDPEQITELRAVLLVVDLTAHTQTTLRV